MFLDYFRLHEQPFGVSPDPRYLFPSAGHREALASLIYGIESNLGFGALIAEPGMGKTTLLFHILEQYRQSARTAFIFNTQCNSGDLLRSLLSELEEDASGLDNFQLHEKFKQILAADAQARRRVILVIDEAQNLGDIVMETVRLLSNFESANFKLLHIILAGQPEFAAKLSRPESSQLQQRIPILTHLPQLSPQDVTSYIDHRLRVAGYQGNPLFTSEAVRRIVWLSRGVPREINRLCFNCLSLAYACSKPLVDLPVIEEVAEDLNLKAPVAVNEGTRPHHFQSKAAAFVAPTEFANSAAFPAGKATAQTSMTGATRHLSMPGPVPAANRHAAAPLGTIVPGAAPPVAPVIPQRPRAFTRSRRRSSIGWSAYGRPVGFALFYLALIAAGWTAVTRWSHMGSRASHGQPETISDANSASSAAEANSKPDLAKTLPSVKNSVKTAAASGQAAKNNVGLSGSDSGSSSRSRRRGSSSTPSQPAQPVSTASTDEAMSGTSPAPSKRWQSFHPSNQPAVREISDPPVTNPSVSSGAQPDLIRYVRPHYPEAARDRHIEGTVVLSAVVAKDGTVKGVRPVSGDPVLLEAAQTAVRDWRYRPYQINGRPVDVDTEIVISFSLPKTHNP